MLPRTQRRGVAEQFGKQFEAAGKIKEAVRACNFLAWAFATSPEPQILDPEEAMGIAQHVALEMTKQQDPLSLDTLAAALAAIGQYSQAVQAAQAAIRLAIPKATKPLADGHFPTFAVLPAGKTLPMRSLDGSDRP